jgi:sugar/nucleoside kinase (ribokinase family)
MSLLVLGTLALDTIKTPYGIAKDILGGSAAHFSMVARLFTDVHLVTVIGDDFPKKYIDFLEKKGIILTSIIKAKGRSFRWQGEYRQDLNTAITLSTELGVLLNFRPDISSAQRNIKYLFLANIDPDLQDDLLGQMRSVSLVGLDSMNYWIKNKRKSLLRLLKKVDIYFANEGEAKELSGKNNLVCAAASLAALGPSTVVIKKGEHGVLLYRKRFIYSLPAFPVYKVIDPTGAGDSFAGGFMGYLAKQSKATEGNIRKAIACAVACASFTVEGFGVSRTARLTLRELNHRLSMLKRIVNF